MHDLNLQRIQLKNLINRCHGNTPIKISLKASPPKDAIVALSLKAFSHSFALSCVDFNTLLQSSFAHDIDIKTVDDDIKAALFEFLIKDYINKAGEILDANIVVDDYIDKNTLKEYGFHINFDLATNNGLCNMTLHTKSADAIEAISQKIRSNCKLETHHNITNKAFLRSAFVIGFSTLSVEDLNNLQLGDAIIMDKCFIDSNSLILTTEDKVFKGNVNDNSFCITGIYNMTETNDTRSDDTTIESLGELKVKIHFELESCLMSIDDLSALQEGSVIDLQDNDLTCVNISCNNQIIGQGRVIALGDRYALEITSLKLSK